VTCHILSMGHTHLYYSFVFYSHINPIMGTETLWENNCHVQYENYIFPSWVSLRKIWVTGKWWSFFIL